MMKGNHVSFDEFVASLSQVRSMVPVENQTLRMAMPLDDGEATPAAILAAKAMEEITKNAGGYEEHGYIHDAKTVDERLLRSLHLVYSRPEEYPNPDVATICKMAGFF